MQDYKSHPFHQYPLFAEEMSIEGSFKRFTSFPTPKSVYDSALLGIPKTLPLTGEVIPMELAAKALNSAVVEIEMSLGCNLSEVQHFHSEDWYPDQDRRFSGHQLPQWPATQIISYEYKYAHVNTQDNYKVQQIPPSWLSLRQNKVNILPGSGYSGTYYVNSNTSIPTGFGPGGLVGYTNTYRPESIQIIYKAGFPHDHLPYMVADLIESWATWRMLVDVLPVLFPTNGVVVGIDGVSQSSQLNISQTLSERIANLEAKKMAQSQAFKSHFVQSVNCWFVGV